jgi:hypothetical protein
MKTDFGRDFRYRHDGGIMIPISRGAWEMRGTTRLYKHCMPISGKTLPLIERTGLLPNVKAKLEEKKSTAKASR